MHGSVRDGLNAQRARLRAILQSRSFADFWAACLMPQPSCVASLGSKDHWEACPECAADFDDFCSHSEMLRSLRSPEDLEPGPGFYARVLQRIEQGAKKSMWWVFAYSPVGKRLAYVTLGTAIVLGSYVVAQESLDGGFSHSPRSLGTLVAQGDSTAHYDAPVIGNTDQRRAAVLENFASHPGNIQ